MPIYCPKCEFFALGDSLHPRSCKLFGFKSKELPSVVVQKSTGHACPAFKEKAGLKP
ncbi:MAG: hypothetical protein Ta2A_16270 [Treponemataceae bacterium]|nr:MAG: hypothetical protein Ta2A_16270 [Treponemataceae bacterium]